MKKVCICGHFGFGKTLLNGQTVKTKIIAEELEEQLGSENVKKIDTHGGAFHTMKSVFCAVAAMFTAKNLIILPAHNGIRIFGPVLSIVKMISSCRLHYVVIGGWLPQLVEDKPSLAKALKNFDAIYVETTAMRKTMEELGFCNIVVMPNCKNLTALKQEELIYHKEYPYPLCTFSRVMEEKGIEDAANVVMQINEQSGKAIYSLDIYGPIDPNYEEKFSELLESWPDYIRYMGSVGYEKSVEVLRNYFLLLFPTRFYTEGIPGTIIDAYAAGVPIVSSEWESCTDIVDDTTGFTFSFENRTALFEQMKEIAVSPRTVWDKKTACLTRAVNYLPSNVIDTIINNLSEI